MARKSDNQNPKKPRNPNPKLSKAAQERRREVDNARRRYQRQADRYRKEAKNLGGRDAEILEAAAAQLEQRKADLKGVNVRKRLSGEIKDLVTDSKNYLVSNNRSDWERGESLGKLRLSGTNLGHRFFALTSSIWAGVPYTGLGDDRRLNAVRDALAETIAQNPDMLAKYGARPNANQMIEIVEALSDIDLDSPYKLGDSEDEAFIEAADRVTNG